MQKQTLRKVGGSVMLTLPPTVLTMLDIGAGSIVSMEFDGDSITILPLRKQRYAIEKFLKRCSVADEIPAQSRAWLGMNSVGREW
ncbi:MAG TPA: AbrB/MazE/SpoVT family DNA-binding domain-containing protein [Acidisarcina sp.]